MAAKTPELTDDEEARIQIGIATDPDNPEWTADDFARARPASEILPPALHAALVRQRGRPTAEDAKLPVKLRLDSKIIAHSKDGGPGWQTRINTFLGANEIVLRMIEENERLLEDLETLIGQFKAGTMRSTTGTTERSITTVERSVAHVKDTVRGLRERLRMPAD